MRLFGLEIGDHAGLPVVAPVHLRADLRAHPRMRAVRADHQIGFEHVAVGETDARAVGGEVQRLSARVDPGEIRLEAQRRIQRALDHRRFDDPRQLRHRRLERGEMQFGVRVAVDAHVVDGPEPRQIERLPDPQAAPATPANSTTTRRPASRTRRRRAAPRRVARAAPRAGRLASARAPRSCRRARRRSRRHQRSGGVRSSAHYSRGGCGGRIGACGICARTNSGARLHATRRQRRVRFAQPHEFAVGLQELPRARLELGFALALVAAHGAVRENAVVHAPQ